MRVKLQLVLCNDEGDEETVTDVITLNKNNQRIEHLGLTLSEAKQLLSTTQRHLLRQQVDAFLRGYPEILVSKKCKFMKELAYITSSHLCHIRHGPGRGTPPHP
jgi:hypothetical protein